MTTVYTQPACQPCIATKRALTKRGVEFREVDLTTDPDALETVRALGHTQAPVVVSGDAHWSGFRPDRIAALAAEKRTA